MNGYGNEQKNLKLGCRYLRDMYNKFQDTVDGECGSCNNFQYLLIYLVFNNKIKLNVIQKCFFSSLNGT